MAGESRYLLRRLSDGASLTLPADAVVTSGDGEELAYNLIRAVESDSWEEEGDGKAQPAPLVLTMTFEGGTESEAAALATAAWSFAKTAYRIERDGRVYRAIRKAKAITVQHIAGSDAKQQPATLTLLPSESIWRSLADNTARLF